MVRPFHFGLGLIALALAACDAPAIMPQPGPPPPNAPLVENVRAGPPHAPYMALDQIAVSDALNLYSVELGDLLVILGRTTLREVQEAVGAGELQVSEDETWLCYTIPNVQQIWLTTNTMSGGEFVTGVRAVANAEALQSAACPTLPASFRRIGMDGLWLGASAAHVQRRFGAAEPHADWRYYSRIIEPRGDRLDVAQNHALALRTENDRVVAIDAERLLTN